MIWRPIRTKDDQAEAILWQELIEQKHLKTGFLLLQSDISQDFYKGKATTLRQHLFLQCQFWYPWFIGSYHAKLRRPNWLFFPWCYYLLFEWS
jgi:hypothetical protein